MRKSGISLAVQWLIASNAGGAGSRTKIPYAIQCDQKGKNKKRQSGNWLK